MNESLNFAWAAAFALYAFYREWQACREHREWREERRALLQAAEPRLRIGPPTTRAERPVWTDAREAAVEREGRERG